MQVLDPNNVKIYNLSSGKSIPEWLSDRKRRLLLKKNVDLRRRIELIQDFEMPVVSSSVRLSPDGQYVIATGIYKPRVRCFDVNNLAMKFERCFDSEVITFEILSEDYSKMVFLQCDRYVEFHSAEGRYYRLRIPKFGRDMKYHPHTCDLCLVGASSDIYRLNLERGQFLPSLQSTHSTEINKVAINQDHGLILAGGVSGKLEAWDPRSGTCVGTLDCALSCLLDRETSNDVGQIPSITSLTFKNSLVYGVGMSTGQILLYDIRNNKPFRVKDHMYELPIKDVMFLNDYVLSMDSSIVKIWNQETGVLFTSIDAGSNTLFNNLCVVPNSGMLFIANENIKIQTYYIPNLGPAPKWCGFLDALTEELEEKSTETMYDDYKFVTEKQLEELGLSHLIGSDLLRGYMHGYFMDVRLYRKAKSIIEPFEFEKYKSKKIKEKLDEEKKNRVRIQKLPAVNKELAAKLMEDKVKKNKRSKGASNLLKDERFKALFENPEFEVDPNVEEYRFLTPALKRLDAHTKETFEEDDEPRQFELEDSRVESTSSDESSDESDESVRRTSSSRKVTIEPTKNAPKRLKFSDLTSGEELRFLNPNRKENFDDEKYQRPLGERVLESTEDTVEYLSLGNRSYSFIPTEKKEKKQMREEERHRKDRKRSRRPAPKRAYR